MPKKLFKRDEKPKLREHLIESIDLPKEAAINMPIITLLGNKDVAIENFDGIIEYGPNLIRLNTNCGPLVIEGEKLEAKSMTSENIKIVGMIKSIAFLR
ncbi:MAG: sporulation protein YqfC [Cellulosilyticaceae bacterium]